MKYDEIVMKSEWSQLVHKLIAGKSRNITNDQRLETSLCRRRLFNQLHQMLQDVDTFLAATMNLPYYPFFLSTGWFRMVFGERKKRNWGHGRLKSHKWKVNSLWVLPLTAKDSLQMAVLIVRAVINDPLSGYWTIGFWTNPRRVGAALTFWPSTVKR